MSNGDFFWLLIISVSQVLNLVATLYSFRRQPPLSEEIYKGFVAKGDLDDLKTHNSKVHAEIFELTRQMQRAHSEDLKTIERAIGRLEGQNEVKPS